MNDRVVEWVINKLKKQEFEYYVNEAFKYFIDNQITAEELNVILKYKGYVLPDSFFELSKPEQKKYRQYLSTKVDILGVEDQQYYCLVYNRVYFYELLNKSKTNKEYSRRLMEYCNYVQDIPMCLISLKNLKLKNVDFFNKIIFDDLKNNYEISTVFDLYSLIEREKSDTNKNREELKKWEKVSEKMLQFFTIEKEEHLRQHLEYPIDDTYSKIALRIERFLDQVNKPKLKNTIKIKSLAYRKEHLLDDDY